MSTDRMSEHPMVLRVRRISIPESGEVEISAYKWSDVQVSKVGQSTSGDLYAYVTEIAVADPAPADDQVKS